MINPAITAQIFSVIGNSSSLVPLGIKDVSNSLGMTAGSYVSGNKVEGKDRFIDEFGTLFIWLLGIPFFKKVIDKTLYKVLGYNPEIDTRVLNNPDIFEKAKEHAAPQIQESFDKTYKNQKLFKGLFLGKFFAATILTFGAYSWLTKARHKHTEKEVMKEIKKEEAMNQSFEQKQFPSNSKQFAPSFGMNWAPLQQFLFDPVKNTMIIDGGITTERLVDSRNPQDLMGYVIKEGGFWAFMYFAGQAIQNYIEKKSAQKGMPIDLDIRVLQDTKLQQAFKDGSIEKHLTGFSLEGTDAEIYESLFNKGENIIVQMAKKADIIRTVDESDWISKLLKTFGFKEHDNSMHEIDSQKYIDMDSIKGTSTTPGIKRKIENLYDAMKKYLEQNKGKTSEDFFKEITKLKRHAVMKNIGSSIGVLGVIIPGVMVAVRYMKKDNKEFQVKTEMKEKLKQQELSQND